MSTISALQSFVVHLLLLLSMVGGSVRSVTGKQNRGKRWSTAYQGWTEWTPCKFEERRNTTIDNMVARALRPTSPGWTPSQWIYQSWRQRGKRRSSSADHASSSDVLLSPYILSLSCDLSMYRVFKHSCFVPGGAILWHYELCHRGVKEKKGLEVDLVVH